ncbi:MAG: gliding motility lipoprotein GldB [Bacteroidetes bacterium]|nr:gliding motility lipoprotein GldB [Bacteroidota bacterium]
MNKVLLVVTSLTVLLVSSCKEKTTENCFTPPSAPLPVNIEYESVLGEISQIRSKQDVVDLFKGREILMDYFFKRPEYPNDSAFINELYRRFTHKGFDTLVSETNKIFGDEVKVKKEFSDAYSHLKYYFPDARIPKIMTTVSGMENDLFFSDSLVIVGLDFFLGPNARYRPNLYNYMLGRYKPESVVPSVMLVTGISEGFNKIDPKDQTALAEMVAYGKAYVFAQHTIPCVPDSTLFGYTPAETAGVYANEDLIWKKMIDDELLFESSHLVKQKYLGERPNTTEISANCPGRIGMWTGMRMVGKYLRDNKLDVKKVMEENDANRLFRNSGYKPVR